MWFHEGKDSQFLMREYQSRQNKTRSGSTEHIVCSVCPAFPLEPWGVVVLTDRKLFNKAKLRTWILGCMALLVFHCCFCHFFL